MLEGQSQAQRWKQFRSSWILGCFLTHIGYQDPWDWYICTFIWVDFYMVNVGKYTRQPWILWVQKLETQTSSGIFASVLFSHFAFLGLEDMDVSKNRCTPQIIHVYRVFQYKPSILRYPYFWKHLYGLKQSHYCSLFDVQSQLTNKFWQNKLHRLFGRFTWCKLHVKRCPNVRLRRWLGKCTSVRSRLKWWPKVSVWRLSGKVTSNGPLFWWQGKMACQTVGGEHKYKVTWSSRYIGVNSNLPTYKIRDRRSFWTLPHFCVTYPHLWIYQWQNVLKA